MSDLRPTEPRSSTPPTRGGLVFDDYKRLRVSQALQDLKASGPDEAGGAGDLPPEEGVKDGAADDPR